MISAFTLGRLPRIQFGPGAFEAVPGIVARHGRRTLLVTGRASLRESGRHQALIAALDTHGVELAGEVSLTGEPTPVEVDREVERHRNASVDVVLGIGGGSVLDGAKAIAGLLRTASSVRDHLEGVGPSLPYGGPAVPFVAVPTTAGTGSEATRNAVLTERGPHGFKRSFRDELLVAADAVVDPDLLAEAPAELVAANGMDAVTQLIESYVSVRAGPITDSLALSGLEAARHGLIAWHADPGGHRAAAARARMAFAALLSGICLANTGLGAVHGLASPLGAMFPIPHGAACGAVLVATIEANVRALRDREPRSPALAKYQRLGEVLGDEGNSLVETLKSWSSTLGIPRLGEFGITAVDVPQIVAESRGSSMRTNPVTLTDAEIEAILVASL